MQARNVDIGTARLDKRLDPMRLQPGHDGIELWAIHSVSSDVRRKFGPGAFREMNGAALVKEAMFGEFGRRMPEKLA